jgi:molecular chaperone GrpE
MNDKPVNNDVQGGEEVAQGESVDEQVEPSSDLEVLQAALEEAEAQADEYLDGWRRAQAEFSNYQKRQRAEQARAREMANADLLRKLLPVLDDFERAMSTMPDALNLLSWTDGIVMIKRKLDGILRSENVEPIDAAGKNFDPRYHQALTYEELEGYESGQVIDEVQRGYVLGDRVLRPALVRVAKAPPSEPEESKKADSEDEKES